MVCSDEDGEESFIVGRILLTQIHWLQAEADGESITPDHITVFAEPTSATESSGAVAKAATINSVLVILANFNGTSVPAYGVAQAQQVMTTNGDSVANFFRQRRRRRRLFAGHRDRGVG